MQMLDIDLPEFFVTHIAKAERLSGDCVRLTMGIGYDNIIEPRYSCIWPIQRLLSRHELLARYGGNIFQEEQAH